MTIPARGDEHQSSCPLSSVRISQFFQENLDFLAVVGALGEQVKALVVTLAIDSAPNLSNLCTLAFFTSSGVSLMYS